MPILVDGNNLLHRLPPGQQSRTAVRQLTLDLVRRESVRVSLVFDGPPPPGTPARENLGRLTIVYSGSDSADDTIVRSLPHGSPARRWVVVTDDRELAARVKAIGATVRSLDRWRHKLLAAPAGKNGQAGLSAVEVSEWEAYFAAGRKEGKAPE
jgi:predicted RNA-binding protein with PIN domain